jgi:hypothetical protein
MDFSRRNFFHLAGAGALVGAAGEFRLNAQQQYPAPVPVTPIFPYTDRAPVSLVKGDNRRKNVLDRWWPWTAKSGPPWLGRSTCSSR